jgi:hypothetical protein
MSIKLLSKNSILKSLPSELIKKDEFLIWDSLRFTFEIIEYNYSELESKLLETCIKNKKQVPVVFNFAWGIIDYSFRLLNIYKQLPWINEHRIIDKLSYLKNFRNTFQHLDERIYKSTLKNRSPIYGIIIWFHKDLETDEINPIIVISGTDRGSTSEFIIPDVEGSEKEVNNIILQTINRKELIRTDISLIMHDLRELCLSLENILISHCGKFNIKPFDWSSKRDIVLRLRSEK